MIPAYQAEGTIEPLVAAVLGLKIPVMVVDDASSDRTLLRARAAGARVIVRLTNGGKGTALREGISEALRNGFDWVIALDADGQHLPAEIPRFLEAAGRGEGDLIIGNRMKDPRGMPLARRVTNGFMSWLLSRLIRQRVPDTQCGFRMMSRRLLSTTPLASSRFEIESELVVRAAESGFRIASVPVTSVYRRNLSFIRPVKDTCRFFLFLLSLRRPLKR
ncbi:MAG: glycosyltransferase family 2 protein [Candidatus Omnitrophica bacterium]|nr:glycosyltransferase family 2 protein [Candidatus Omnitrophota bacterium]